MRVTNLSAQYLTERLILNFFVLHSFLSEKQIYFTSTKFHVLFNFYILESSQRNGGIWRFVWATIQRAPELKNCWLVKVFARSDTGYPKGKTIHGSIFNWAAKESRASFGFALRRGEIGRENSLHFLSQLDSKLIIYRDVVTLVFSLFLTHTYNWFEFSLARCVIFLYSDWPSWLLSIGFTTANRNTQHRNVA